MGEEWSNPRASTAESAVELESTVAAGAIETAPSSIGPYRLLELIGQGGMGEVWLAEQTEPVRRRVAIKLIKLGMDTREVVARFESERQALALMDHPAIAKVFEAGSTREGRPYFVMEYVAGIPITDFCDQHRLTERQRMELLKQVCEGVQHAHQKAVIHRDLKPSNILVSEVDGKPLPRIIDFGVAKATSQRLSAESMYTQVGAIVGTLGYMSPEQADSGGADVDTRTDVYSLGVVLYELLVGAQPFDFRKLPLDEILRRLRSEDAIPPSVKLGTLAQERALRAQKHGADIAARRRELRGDADAIALKALEKDRDRRYATPSDLAADIARYLRNEPVVARPASAAYRARKYIRRHRTGVAIAAAAMLLLVAFAVVQAVELQRIRQERALAEQRASDLVELANRTLFDVHAAVAPLAGALEARRTIVKTALEYLERLEREGRRDERTERVLSDAYYKVAMIQYDPFGASLQDFDGAARSLHKAEALVTPLYQARSSDPELMQSWVEIKSALAALAQQASQQEAAVQQLLKILPVAQRLGELRSGDFQAAKQEALVEWQLADYIQYTDPVRALDFCNREIALLHRLIARFPGEASLKQDLGVALGMAAGSETRRGELEHAGDLYRQSIESREQLLAANPNDIGLQRGLLVAYGNYATVLGIPWMPNLGRPEEARAACKRSVEMARRLASADAQNATARFDLGASLARLGSIDPPPGGVTESLDNLREAIAILEGALKTNSKAWLPASSLIIALEYAGHRLESLGKRDEAADQYKRALAIAEPYANAGNLSMISGVLANEEALALLYAGSANRAAALDFARRAEALAAKEYSGPKRGDTQTGNLAKACYVFAMVEMKFNEWTDARAMAMKAGALWPAIQNPGTILFYRAAMQGTASLKSEIAKHVAN